MNSGGGFGKTQRKCGQTLFQRLILVIARMHNEEVGCDRFGPVEFTAKGRYRLRANVRVERRQVHQIVGVDHEGREIETLARGGKAADVVRVRLRSAPHTRTGGEDLEGVGAEPVSFEAGLFEGFGA